MSHLARSIRRCLALATVTTTSLCAGTAFAATNELEEIVVTAQKQEQKLSETPLSVTALSSTDLTALAATQFRDFANTVPGLGFTSEVAYDLATGNPLDGDLEQQTILPQGFEQEFDLYSGTLVYDFGPAELTSVTSYQEFTNDSTLDASPLYVPLLNAVLPHPPFPTWGATGVDYGITTDKFTQ